MRRAAGISAQQVVLLSVGRLEENKGFHVLAAALGGLAAHGGRLPEGWRWIVVGDGPFRNRLESAIAEAGIGSSTVLVGRLSDHDLHAWYEAATMFVHPTQYEGSSLVTLEAMAHRRAVVATRAGGLPDKVRPGINGWLVEPGDSSALAAAISGAVESGDVIEGFGTASRRIVEEEFSWDAAGRATVSLYEELLGAIGPRSSV
jgi:glycosyltransferase involved in cell wall biosynthesis